MFIKKTKISQEKKKMSNNICPICNVTVTANIHGMKLDCGHWVHTKCLDKKNPNFVQCTVNCNGNNTNEREELPATDKNDYVLNPPNRTKNYVLGLFKKKDECYGWLAEKKPIKWMIQDKGYGLQRLLEAGVSINHFIENNYTWDDLKIFKDLSLPERGRMALVALGCNAEHFRDYPQTLDGAIKDLEITPKHMVELYGISFPEDSDKPMCVVDATNNVPWTASDLVKLGFKMKDLKLSGMQYYEQFEHLRPSEADYDALGISENDELPRFHPIVITKQPLTVMEPEPKPMPAPTKRAFKYVPKSSIKTHGLKNEK